MGDQDQEDHGPTYLQLQPKTVGEELATMYHDAKGVDLPPLNELLVGSHLFFRCPFCESDCVVTSTTEHMGAPLYS
jgi:ABC-type antimicrobial peptide transport system ATPase subunit